MTYQEILNNARTCMGPYCKSCPTCNGLACKNTVPGPGAKGIGTGFIRNYQKWQELCVNMDTICENKPVDTSYNFFGKQVVLPVFAAPVGAMQLHYGDKYDDLTYNDILVSACADAGIAAFTGDGVDAAVFQGAMEAIRTAGGVGVPTIKPWNQELVFEKLDLARTSGCKAVAMDIDGAGLPFLKNMTPPAGSKSVQELAEIIRYAGMPFIVKGVMTVRGAQKAAEAAPAAGEAKAAAPKSSPKPSNIAVRNVRRALCRRSCPSASSRSKKLMMSSARPFTRALTCTGGTTRKARSPRQRPRAGLSQDSGAPVRPPAQCRRSRPRKPCALYRPPFSGSVPVPFPAWRPCPRRPRRLFRREISPAFPSDRAGCSVHSATYPCFLHFFQP